MRYWSSLEIKFLKGSERHGKCKGGFVYAFLMAEDVRDALPRLLDEMAENRFGVIAVEFLSPYEDASWETPEDDQRYQELAKEAEDTNSVVLDVIYAYEED